MIEVPKIRLSESLELSRLVHGHWRLSEWGMDRKETLSMIETLLDWGITSFDHADIYGDYTCDQLFGDALSLNPRLRDHLQIITRCHFPHIFIWLLSK